MPLSLKHQRFVAEYLKDLNATQAAIRAGYASKNADVTGPRLLGNVGISAAIAEATKSATAKALSKYEITKERVLAELALLGFSNMQDFASVDGQGKPDLDFSTLDREQWAAVSQIKVDDDGAVTLKLYDKRAALVDLGKHLSLFNEKHDHRLVVDQNKPLDIRELSREVAFILQSGVQALEEKPPEPLH